MMSFSTQLASRAHAAWWTHLEVMNHTLGKVLSRSGDEPLNELELEHLESLAALLRALHAPAAEAGESSRNFLAKGNGDQGLVPDFSVKERFSDSPKFRKWRKAQGHSFEDGVKRLMEATTEYSSLPKEELLTRNAPRDEFSVLKEVIEGLLARTDPLYH